jgi:hypothetical protein
MKTVVLGIFLAIASIHLISCANQNPNEIPLFNTVKFLKLSTENVKTIDSASQSEYENFFNNVKEIQLPLYRVVEGESYDIYLGIPFRCNLKKLFDARQKALEKDSLFLTKKNLDQCFYQYKKDDLFFTEYLLSLGGNSIICIFGVTNNPQTMDTLFNQESISKRVTK